MWCRSPSLSSIPLVVVDVIPRRRDLNATHSDRWCFDDPARRSSALAFDARSPPTFTQAPSHRPETATTRSLPPFGSHRGRAYADGATAQVGSVRCRTPGVCAADPAIGLSGTRRSAVNLLCPGTWTVGLSTHRVLPRSAADLIHLPCRRTIPCTRSAFIRTILVGDRSLDFHRRSACARRCQSVASLGSAVRPRGRFP